VAHLVLVLAVVAWSFSFLGAARLRQDLGLTEALAARFVPVLIGAALVLLARRPLRLPHGSWAKIAAMALLGVPGYHLFFLHGMKTVPSGTAALIVALNPVFTAVLARLALGEEFGSRKIVGLVLALAGVFVVIRYGTDRAVDWPYLSSALLLTLSPLCWAIYTVIGRALASSPGALGAALYLAIPCSLLAYAGWIWALKRVPAGDAAAFVFLNAPLANLWAWFLEGATLRPPFVLGALVLLVGVAAIVLPGPRWPAPRLSGKTS
jgi:drug/metabolite transporter (DMT)-like permease